MTVLNAFWVSAGAAVGIAALTVLLLRRPLHQLLIELCGGPVRAHFWSVFSAVAIPLTALLGMMASFPLHRGGEWAEFPQLPMMLSALRTSLFFLLFALLALGFVLLLGISRYEYVRRYGERRAAVPPPLVS